MCFSLGKSVELRDLSKNHSMHENEISQKILNASFEIHKTLGPGLFESVYLEILKHELTNYQGLTVECQKAIPVIWKGIKMETAFRCDMIVNSMVIVEIKSVSQLADVHKKQLLTYLRLTNLKLGLLLNFNEGLLKNGITRVVNGLKDEVPNKGSNF
jgi:GxxExxY protein